MEFGVDGNWQDATVVEGPGKYAWSRWDVTWAATPGEHILQCRATDAAGQVQPLDAPWDMAGFANNSCQKVEVYVGDP